MRIASLPMYDHPEVRGAVDGMWSKLREGLRARGVEAPDALTRGDDHRAPWSDPALVVTQCCGWDVRQGAVPLLPVASPRVALPGCPPGCYRSAWLVRDDAPATGLAELEGARLAMNESCSWSGRVILERALDELGAPPGYFSDVTLTGGHRASVEAVRAGHADFASIDVVALAILDDHRLTTGTRVIGYSAPAPAPPFAIRADADPREAVAVREVLEELGAIPEVFLDGVVSVEPTFYAPLEAPGYDLLGDRASVG